MRISDFTPPAGRAPVDFNVEKHAPVPPERPPEAGATFTPGELLDRAIKTLNRNQQTMLKSQSGASESRSQMWSQQLRQCGSVMTYCLQTLPMEQRQQLLHEQSLVLSELSKACKSPEITDAFDVGVKSSNDFFDKLLELIDLIKNGYLAGYEHIIAAYSDFFADFNKEITAKMKDWIEGANDGKEVQLNARAIRLALQGLIEKYSKAPAGVLFPAPGMEGASKEEAEKWRLALGLPASCLKDNGDGTFSVMMDLGPLIIMSNSLPWFSDWVTWDTSKFQAWQTGFNAQEERLKNMLQSFTQKYSNANSYHDNFNKTLSSHLNQYSDMLKAMLNF